MRRMVFFGSSILLLCFVFSFVHGQSVPPSTTNAPLTASTTNASLTTSTSSTTQATQTTKKAKKTTKKYRDYYQSGYGSNDGYLDVIGDDGIDPRKDGSDVGDFGPVYSDKKPILSSLNLWIYAEEDRDNGKGRYSGQQNNYNQDSNNYNQNNNNDYNAGDNQDNNNYNNNNNDYNAGTNQGYRKKRSYSKIRFPVKQIRNYRKFPRNRFPPLISIFPWVPIFYDKLTYQTIIFSPIGGIYIIPPLINFYGRRFAVAQLIKWGYASLVSSGAPIAPGVDVAPLIQPVPAGGAVGGAVGGGPGPSFNSNTARFNGGVKTDFRTFKPRYSQTLDEGGDSSYGRAPKPNYGGNSDYGGTRNQQLYPQGGPQNGGG